MHEMEICSAILFFCLLSLSSSVLSFKCKTFSVLLLLLFGLAASLLHRDVFKNNQQKAKRVGLKFLVTRYFGRCHITRLCRCCCYFSQLATTQHFLHSRAFRHWRRSICALGNNNSTFILLLSILSLIILILIILILLWNWRFAFRIFRKGVLDCSCLCNDVRSWASRLACHKGLQSHLVYHSQLWWARNCIDSTYFLFPSNSPVIQHYYSTTTAPYRSKNACFSYVLCSATQRFSTQCSLAVMKRNIRSCSSGQQTLKINDLCVAVKVVAVCGL